VPRLSDRRPLIVGSGIAGLYVALRCREVGLRPYLITKGRLDDSNTRYAQGGIAAAIGADDHPGRHLRDTLRAGDGLVDPEAARVLTEAAPHRIADLVRMGVPFDTVEGQISLGREAAHSRSRILHAGGDATGLQIEETLKRRALDAGLELRERTGLVRLERDRAGRARALVRREPGGSTEVLEGGPIVLATGGAGSLYRQSSNPSVATGEGVAIAFRAGALVSDMEFIQFHPTTFHREGAPRHLITEAVRGEGAVLRNEAGERFMPKYHPQAELAPRDVVSRAIRAETIRTGTRWIYLDATGIPRARLFSRFPSLCRFLAHYGLDPSRDRIPVSPAAHYMIGGVTTDLDGRTSIPGLYACGEVAATGVHGANRLASNSLLEGLVFGERVVQRLRRPVRRALPRVGRTAEVPLGPGEGRAGGRPVITGVRDILWDLVGVVRDGSGLASAAEGLRRFAQSVEPSSPERLPSSVANAVLLARLIAEAALVREESRGTHFRSDFPRARPSWRLHLGLRAVPGPGSALA
jgi:L-aspartate oxidase